jgi:hypothetical protein
MDHRWLSIEYEADLPEDESGLTAVVRVIPGGLGLGLGRDARLRVRTLPSGGVEWLKQIEPTPVDLTALRAPLSPVAGDYPISLGDHQHVYELRLTLKPEPPGDQIRAALVTLVIDQQEQAKEGLFVEWSENEESVPTVRTGPTLDDAALSEPTVRTTAPGRAPAAQAGEESREAPQ